MMKKQNALQVTVVIILLVSVGALLLATCQTTEKQEGLQKKEVSKAEKLETSISSITRGLMAYSIPLRMRVGETYKATVSITRSQSDSILFDGLDVETGDFVAQDIRIGSIAKVRLVDPESPENFRIKPINTEEQYVDSTSNTVWQWNVTPQKAGQNKLYLIATAKILHPVEGYKDIRVFDKAIKVQSDLGNSAGMFLRKHWQWLIGVILIPLIGWLANRWSARRKKT